MNNKLTLKIIAATVAAMLGLFLIMYSAKSDIPKYSITYAPTIPDSLKYIHESYLLELTAYVATADGLKAAQGIANDTYVIYKPALRITAGERVIVIPVDELSRADSIIYQELK